MVSLKKNARSWQSLAALVSCLAAALVGVNACAAGSEYPGDDGSGNGSGGNGGNAGGGGSGGLDFTSASGGGVVSGPKTCAEAEANSSYIGCDFFPTITPNVVSSIFDYAVVVANTGENVVDVTTERGNQVISTIQVQPNSLGTVYLPWVPELKGPDIETGKLLTASVRVADGAYHVTTTFPVTMYQFNALEYAGVGGPPGKDWSKCSYPCFSFTNDASLLLPATAMTGNYRIVGLAGWSVGNIGPSLTITGTQDNTTVDVFLSGTGQILGGGGIPATEANGTANFTINRGEVVTLIGSSNSDYSGSRMAASAPVQAISSMPCVNVPESQPACDHVEESIFPAETLGRDYYVTRPSDPLGYAAGHKVRIFGNVDGTILSYPVGKPAGAPTTIAAGEVVDLGIVYEDFQIVGDQAFAVASFQQGASVGIASDMGDPSMTLAIATEQFRLKYVFLAPTDYDVSFVDIIQPMDAVVTVDGKTPGIAPKAIGSGSDAGFGVSRVRLDNTGDGIHVVEASKRIGIQVSGYGAYTSYYYPGGLNLDVIAPPPVN